jgi:lipid II:glycine glycyltransferase (peptidoglycan interpeptide bridge formation enzyme)
MLWVPFPAGGDDNEWRERLFQQFHPQTRKNIRIGERQGLEVVEAQSEEQLREAYLLMEIEAHERRLAFRSWRHFGGLLIEQVRNGQAMVFVARHEGRILCVRYGWIAGRRYTHAAGARVSVEKLKAGHYVAWVAMKKARERGLIGYDFRTAGDPGIMRFKMGFRPEHVYLVEPHCLVFSKRRYETFRYLYTRLRRHQELISKVLDIVRQPRPHNRNVPKTPTGNIVDAPFEA